MYWTVIDRSETELLIFPFTILFTELQRVKKLRNKDTFDKEVFSGLGTSKKRGWYSLR